MLEPDINLGMPKRIYNVVIILLSKDKSSNIEDTGKDAAIEELGQRKDDDKIIPRSLTSAFINCQSFQMQKM